MGQTHHCHKTSKFRNSCYLNIFQITDNENVIVTEEVVFSNQFVTFICQKFIIIINLIDLVCKIKS